MGRKDTFTIQSCRVWKPEVRLASEDITEKNVIWAGDRRGELALTEHLDGKLV